MQQFRTTKRFVRVLIAAFPLAQFAGIVSSPLASAKVFVETAAHAYSQHAHLHHHSNKDKQVDDAADNHVDGCCALHAFFAGVLPSVMAVECIGIIGQRVVPRLTQRTEGITLGRIDRPPKPVLRSES